MKSIRATGVGVVLLTMSLSAAAAASDGRTRPASNAEEEVRHSGIITDLAAKDTSFTFEEIVTWTGPGTGRVKRSVALTPQTSVQLVTRDEEPSRTAMPGYKETPLRPSDLRPGEFVTVTTAPRQDRVVAVSVEVVRPSRQ